MRVVTSPRFLLGPACLVLAVVAITAQEGPPLAILRGDLLESEGSDSGGEFSVRAADNHVHRCSFSDKTYVERDRQRASMTAAVPGESVEIVVDNAASAGKCYARTVYLLGRPRPKAALPRPRALPWVGSTEHFAPRGNLTFAGIVLRVNPDFLVLRTRSAGQKTVVVRQDTRFLDSGAPATLSALKVSTMVFIRAGKNFDDEIEAYQVVWGDIILPPSDR